MSLHSVLDRKNSVSRIRGCGYGLAMVVKTIHHTVAREDAKRMQGSMVVLSFFAAFYHDRL